MAYIVRSPKPLIAMAAASMLIPVIGLRMAISGRGHWTIWHVGFFAIVTLWVFLSVLSYQTTFGDDAVEQKKFLRRIRRFRYPDIEQVKLHYSGRGNVLLISTSNGQNMKVYGNNTQLYEAHDLLYEKIPHAFKA